MSIPPSERRSTSEGIPMATLSCASTPKDTQGFSKAGRRVLAELVCNDSPVVGLLPPGTPSSSCKQKSGSEVPLRSRRALLPNTPSHPASTPLGESLLRSQVQLLLQKVESDMCAPPCLRASVPPPVCSGFMVSPTMLAAPTPLNTPAAMAPMVQLPQPISEVHASQDASADKTLLCSSSTDGADAQSIRTDAASEEQDSVQNGLLMEGPNQQDVLSMSGSFTTFVSTSICLDMKPLQPTSCLSEVSDAPSPSELFPGKRVLHFDDDTPCRASATEQYGTTIFEETGRQSFVRELDDDEASEWSMHVNVGSPADKQSVIEQAVGVGESSEAGEGIPLSLNENQQKSSRKVDLLWRKRRGAPYRREYEYFDEEEEADYSEQYYAGNEGKIEEEGECDNLCNMFKDMRFEEEETKGLPRGEGKHIRFLYGEDEDGIVEAMVVRREEEVCATHLNGLPAPLGRHWRFVDEDEGDSGQ